MDTENLRLAVYRAFSSSGRVPDNEGLARQLDVTEEEVRAGLVALHRDRHVVLDEAGAIVMAHPFSAVPMGFSVMGSSTLWWGGCAWDSFALPHLLPDEPELLVATRCPGCGAALSWTVHREASPEGDHKAHFLTPVARVWDDVVRACANQRLFCNDKCIAAWLRHTGNTRGAVFDLATLWRLAAHWYDGRLERGYTRREPAQAFAYFADVGLQGPFWGHPADGGTTDGR